MASGENLQAQTSDRFTRMKQAVDVLESNILGSLASLLAGLDEFRADLEAAGHVHCARLFTEFRGYIAAIDVAYRELAGRYQVDEFQILQFFLHDTLQSLEAYVKSLKDDPADSEQRMMMRKPAVDVLAGWRPTRGNSAVPSPEAAPPVSDTASPSASTPAPTPTPAAVKAAAPSAPERRTYLICRNSAGGDGLLSARRTFAVPVQNVLEVIHNESVMPLVPHQPGVIGMLNFRGYPPLAIVACRDRGESGEPLTSDDPKRKKDFIIIAKVEDRLFGFQMEQVLSVAELDPSRFQTPKNIVAPVSSWVTHMVDHENDIVLVMDLARAVAA